MIEGYIFIKKDGKNKYKKLTSIPLRHSTYSFSSWVLLAKKVKLFPDRNGKYINFPIELLLGGATPHTPLLVRTWARLDFPSKEFCRNEGENVNKKFELGAWK